jgi:GT2 family glycosyltransferase
MNIKFVSLGGWCGTTMALRKNNLYSEALPFDHIRSSFVGIIDSIENNFINFFPAVVRLDEFENYSYSSFRGNYFGFYHHDIRLRETIETFEKRFWRFNNLLSNGTSNIVFVRTIVSADYNSELLLCDDFMRVTKKKYPCLNFILVMIIPNQYDSYYNKKISDNVFLFSVNDYDWRTQKTRKGNPYKIIFDFILNNNLFDQLLILPENNAVIKDCDTFYELVEGVPFVDKNNIPSEDKVSVIVSSFENFDSLLKTLDSIKNQTYGNIEIIVVNDKSSDERYYNYDWSKENIIVVHLKKHCRKVLRNYGYGGYLKNKGIEVASGTWIAFCNDNVIWHHDKIKNQISFMLSYRGDACCTDGYIVNENSKRLYNADINLNDCVLKYKKKNFAMDGFPVVWTKKFLKTYKFTFMSSLIMKKDIINKVGLIDVKVSSENYNYCLKIAENSRFVYLNEPLFEAFIEKKLFNY